MLGGIVWPRANRWGAAASLLASLTTNFLLYYATGQRLDHWDANVFLVSLAVGTVTLVAVSLLTAPEPQHRIDDFFERLQISSDSPSQKVPTLLLCTLLRFAGRGLRDGGLR